MKPHLTVPLAIIAGGIIVAIAVYVSANSTVKPKTGNADLVAPVTANDHILGNPAAPVVIVEYSDFDCTFCKGFNDTLHQIIANVGVNGQVAWVYRHFPLIEIHQNTMSHARAAECVTAVAGNGAFWKFADLLFANQPTDPSKYGELASSVGISGDAFAGCYSNVPKTIDDKIAADRKNALDMGASGTPFSVVLIKGKPPVIIESAYSYDAMKAVIDQALAQ